MLLRGSGQSTRRAEMWDKEQEQQYLPEDFYTVKIKKKLEGEYQVSVFIKGPGLAFVFKPEHTPEDMESTFQRSMELLGEGIAHEIAVYFGRRN